MWRIVRAGTHEALDRLKSAGLKLGIVSNADGRVADDARRFGLAKYFDVIIDSQVVGVEKPNPKIFQLALDALGVPPEEALYAGDIYSIDMLGARSAGIDRQADRPARNVSLGRASEDPSRRRTPRHRLDLQPEACGPDPCDCNRETRGHQNGFNSRDRGQDCSRENFLSGSIIRSAFTGESEEVADGVMFCRWFANVSAIKTREGLVLIDTGAYFNQRNTLEVIRRYSKRSHQHGDLYAWPRRSCVRDAGDRGRGGSQSRRASSRRRTSRGRGALRSIQTDHRLQQHREHAAVQSALGVADHYVYPDTYFDHQLNIVAGNHKFECHHARGETDDHCWVYFAAAKVLFTGDLIIWAAPNAGNPQKAQRYAREWAEALRAMAKLGANVLVPGHGYPVFGAMKVRQVLNDTAEYLGEPVSADPRDDERGRVTRRHDSYGEAARKIRG